jgi:hypothetical protein
MPFCFSAQTSYEFSQPLPPGGLQILSPQPNHFGEYKSHRSDILFELSENGIFAVTTIINSVSKDSILKATNYHVKDNYLFGIKGIDSIQVILLDNKYYFGIKHREEIIGTSSKNVLIKISSQSYMLNFYENGAYQPCLFSVVDDNLSIQYFDYETDTQVFSKMPKQKEKRDTYLNTITLAPQKQDFFEINLSEMFGSANTYTKVYQNM